MRKQLLSLGIILITAIALAPLLRDFIREFVVVPLLYAFWIGQIIFDAIPQAAFWSCFLGVALLLAGASLLRPGKPRSQSREAGTIQRGRVETWANLIRQAPQEDYYQWRLAQPLRELILETLAYEARLSTKEMKQRLMDDQLDLPPEIRAYLQASLKSLTYLPAPRFPFAFRGPASPLALNPEVLVQFLEDSASHPAGDRKRDA
jgi:hypothetical protein